MRTTLRRVSRPLSALGVGLTLLAAAGCQSAGGRRTVSAEPALGGTVDPATGGTIVTSNPPPSGVTTVGWVDRHPLFSKPREYYDTTTNQNRVVKTASAAFLGVPAGIYGELKQIVVGTPSTPRY